ncbi:(d)CMP kinase [Flavobacterium sp. HSC-61S13]|uniref:(d)CMP kinase n=1 Tax=Flavobacterium sp. HSC-61S13 TaxID=2910963 RepID=UPI00209DA8FF|nr:(d)CMP kinase [Flavobacterium sp. HSC-61S13]MCP1995742.1 cytidylate kinase [Flavobacterium sp. HSC-61S13]
MKKITIAIDGYSSTGKSTLAKQLAKELGYVYIDTGAMYRAVTFFAMQKGLIKADYFDQEGLIEALDQIQLEFQYNAVRGFAEIHLNQKNVEEAIRTLEVSSFVSQVAQISEVRKKLVEQQQSFGRSKGVVMDGRDIGTVVFPDAELKIFMTASPEVRARRRFDELVAKSQKVTFEEVYQNVVERDRIDTSREDSPLVKAVDAIEFDNTTVDKEAQFLQILELAKQVLAKQ